MSGSGQEALPCGRDALSDVWEWSGCPLGFPGLVRRPSWMSGSVRESLPDVRVWSGGYPRCP